jgi:hypothetical protein
MLKARMAALLAERWDFAAAPLTQLLDFQARAPPADARERRPP